MCELQFRHVPDFYGGDSMGYWWSVVESEHALVDADRIPLSVISKLNYLEIDESGEVFLESIYNLHRKLPEVCREFELISNFIVKPGLYVFIMEGSNDGIRLVVDRGKVKITEGKLKFVPERDVPENECSR